ncbi:MAG: RHS repeat protein [Chloroflexota bacterium]|nr:RHS repeat protein [Chloroflexota bacterium]
MCSSTDGKGNVTSYTYNTAGNLATMTPLAPLGAVISQIRRRVRTARTTSRRAPTMSSSPSAAWTWRGTPPWSTAQGTPCRRSRK